jgi:hypothetical protein
MSSPPETPRPPATSPAALVEEADTIAAATGNVHFDYASRLLAALRGHEPRQPPDALLMISER